MSGRMKKLALACAMLAIPTYVLASPLWIDAVIEDVYGPFVNTEFELFNPLSYFETIAPSGDCVASYAVQDTVRLDGPVDLAAIPSGGLRNFQHDVPSNAEAQFPTINDYLAISERMYDTVETAFNGTVPAGIISCSSVAQDILLFWQEADLIPYDFQARAYSSVTAAQLEKWFDAGHIAVDLSQCELSFTLNGSGEPQAHGDFALKLNSDILNAHQAYDCPTQVSGWGVTTSSTTRAASKLVRSGMEHLCWNECIEVTTAEIEGVADATIAFDCEGPVAYAWFPGEDWGDAYGSTYFDDVQVSAANCYGTPVESSGDQGEWATVMSGAGRFTVPSAGFTQDKNLPTRLCSGQEDGSCLSRTDPRP